MPDENAPLLPTSQDTQPGENSKSRREYVAEKLESRRLHKIVIALITIDAICVLADLSYTFLHDSCSEGEERDPLWLEIFSYISTGITTLFLIEIPLALYGFGASFYDPFGSTTHSRLHLFDAMVIVTTFVLEVALRGRERELASLLIILRLWRLVKLVGGVAVGAGELSEELEKRLAQTEKDLQAANATVHALQEENAKLRAAQDHD